MAAAAAAGWDVVVRAESAAEFHARAMPTDADRAVWVCEPAGPALVLGSTQRADVIDHERCRQAGVDVVRRRSGGGAVLVVPDDVVWLDVIVPRDDPLWADDVGVAAHWLGDAWRQALASVGVETRVHRGPLVRTEWSDLVCFAGLGPGEVTVPGGAKVVGLSQRRTRAAARFQCAALLRWDPAALLDLLAFEPVERARAAADLAGVATGVTAQRGAVLDALLAHLP